MKGTTRLWSDYLDCRGKVLSLTPGIGILCVVIRNAIYISVRWFALVFEGVVALYI
jgi:hypothetical protein